MLFQSRNRVTNQAATCNLERRGRHRFLLNINMADKNRK